MGLNIDNLLASKDLVIQRRVTRYDVSWGKPFGARDYRRVVLADNPVLYWRMESDITGPTISVNLGSGTSGDATYPAGVTWLTTATDDIIDGCNEAVVLDGARVITTSYNLVQPNTTRYELTLEGWVKPDFTGGTGFGSLISKYHEFDLGFVQVTGTTSKVRFTIYYNNAGLQTVTLDSSTELEAGGWYHVVGVLRKTNLASNNSGQTMEIYINGVLDATRTDAGLVEALSTHASGNNNVTLGARVTGVGPITYDYLKSAMDEPAVYTYGMPAAKVQQHYLIGTNKIYSEPDEDIESDALYVLSDTSDYKTTVLNSQPTHYWRFGEASGATTALDLGLNTTNSPGTYKPLAQTAIVNPGALRFDTDVARAFNNNEGGQSEVQTANSLNLGTAGAQTAFSVEFWYRRLATSTEYDGLLGFYNASSNGAGFGVRINGTTMYFNWFSSPGVASQLTTNVNNFRIEKNVWYHVVFTISTTGLAKVYVNGVLRNTLSTTRSLKVPPTTDRFKVGQMAWTQDSPTFHMDEVAMYLRELSAQESALHYLKGAYGSSVGTSTLLNGGDDDGSPYTLACSDTASLINAEDITGNVESYTINRDLSQLIDTAEMHIYESWGSQNLRVKLKANTYVKIEEQYSSRSLSYTSGWQSVGHYLVEGPIGSTITSDGTRVAMVALRGILKLSNLDICHTAIEPDTLLVSRRNCTLVPPISDTYDFGVDRPGYTSETDPDLRYYTNWVDEPKIKLWVTKFQTYDATKDKDVNGPSDILRIKGAEGSVQVLGGLGRIRIDKTFYEDYVYNNGLGNPDYANGGVQTELYRFATKPDVDFAANIATIAFDGNWYITANNLNVDADRKTMFVKTGNAKGNIYKLSQIRNAESPATFGTFASSNRGSGDNIAWVNPSNAQTADTSYATSTVVAQTGTYTKTSAYLKATAPTGFNIPTGATIVGIEFTVNRFESNNISTFLGAEVKDLEVYVIKGGTVQTAQNKAHTTAVWPPNDSTAIVPFEPSPVTYGGPSDLWGVTWSASDFNSTFGLAIAVTFNKTRNPSFSIVANIDYISCKVTYSVLDKLYIRDVNFYPVNPSAEGLQVGDVVQVGDCNRVEDAIRKVLLKAGFQERDANAPFYFQLEDCDVETTLPPLRLTIEDNRRFSEVLTEILSFAPPNYSLYVDNAGVTRTKNIRQTGPAVHTIAQSIDYSEDRSDYGIYTRLVAQGVGGDSVNVASTDQVTATPAVRAYKLDNFAKSGNSNGEPKSQYDANIKAIQVFDSSPKTPLPTGYDNEYGLIYEMYGTKVKRWTFEDTPLFCVDVGPNPSRNAGFYVEAIDMQFINTYKEGTTLAQTMYVYYMTEDDYVAENGYAPPAVPNQGDADLATSYMPKASSRMWKLLVDEVGLKEGSNTIEASDFVGGKPVRARFFKFVCGQAHYRFETPSDTKKYARVDLAGCKIYTSRKITAVAELGVSGDFNTGDYRKLANRLRRRTYILDQNPYLSTFQQAKDFALAELQERFKDFTPISVTTIAPTVDIGDIVAYTNPSTYDSVDKTTPTTDKYIVQAKQHMHNGQTKLQLVNYSAGV